MTEPARRKDGGKPDRARIEEIRVLHESEHKSAEAQRIAHICRPVFDEQGRYLGIRGSDRDVTGRQQAERNIALLSYALNNVREAAFLTDEDARLHFVNEEACRVLGYTREELLGLGLQDIDADFSMECWRDRWSYIKTHRSPTLERRHRAKDGHTFPVEINSNYFVYGGQGYNMALARDITERKRAEQEHVAHLHFLEAMDRVNRAIQASNDVEQVMSDVLDAVLAIFSCDRAFLSYPCDPAAAVWQVPMERCRPGYSNESVLGPEQPMTPDVAGRLRLLLASDGPVKFGPHDSPPLAKEAQRLGVMSLMSMAIHPKVGKPWQFGIHQCSHPRAWTSEEERLLQEIGRRLTDGLTTLLANRELRQNEQRFRLVFENSPVSIWEEDFSAVKSFLDDLRTAGVTDIESYFERRPEAVRRCAELTKIVDVNRASLALHGAANKDELLARLAETFTPESHETFRQKLVCLWKGRTEMAAEGVVKTLAGEFRRVTVSFSVCPGYEKSLGKVYASLIDVTERKRAETQAQERREELLHVSRLNTLGEMASGLAHELSQPLSAIVNHTEACIRRIASSQVDGAGIVRGLEKVADQAKRAGNILGRIRALAQRRPPRFAAVNVNEVVEDVIDLISWEVRHWEVTVKLKLGPALPAVYADRIQIEQVVLNLVRNAIEAMIAVEQRRRLLTVRTRAGGDGSVQVEVCDTGVGFPEDDADRIFQPFFTTKANGLGIGLSISRTIAEMHNGTLEAKRNVDCGSTLVLVLPIA